MGLYLVPVIFRFELPDFDWGDVSRGSVADRVSSYSRGSRDEGKVKLVGRSLEPNPIMDVSKNSGTPKSKQRQPNILKICRIMFYVNLQGCRIHIRYIWLHWSHQK